MSQPRSHDVVALTVVRFLGAASVLGITASAVLAYVALRYEGNSNAAVVIAIVGNLASAAVASLGSILASTGKGAAPAPQPVEVVNTPEKPANVTEQPMPVAPVIPANDPEFP